MGKVVQWVRLFAIKPDNMNSIPGTHMLEKTDSCSLCSDIHTCTVAHTKQINVKYL